MLKSLMSSGRRLLLVTGRELPDILPIFPEIDLFERVVAENGGWVYRLSTKAEGPLAEAPPEEFIAASPLLRTVTSPNYPRATNHRVGMHRPALITVDN